jgi:hypothetical protein
MNPFASFFAMAGFAGAATGGAWGQDISAMYNQWAAGQNAQMGQMLNGVVQQNMNDPRVVAMYNQAVASGQFRGDLATFAYTYAATGGFSAEGMRAYADTSQQIARNEQQAWAGYQGAVQDYRDAYAGYTQGHSNNMQEAGRGLNGQSTYYGYGGAQVLPHTWQANTVHDWQGQRYYVDQAGQYWRVDPYNPGWMYPLNR